MPLKASGATSTVSGMWAAALTPPVSVMLPTMAEYEVIEAAGIEVRLSNPGKIFFPERGITKLDLARYYLELAGPVTNQLRDRPTVLKRFVDGAAKKPFFQKRIPDTAPEWLQTAEVTFPSGRTRPRASSQRCRAPVVGSQSGGDRLEPVGGAAARSRPSR